MSTRYISPAFIRPIAMLAAWAILLTIALAVDPAGTQGYNGRGKCMQPFGTSFDLVGPGSEDEWLSVYLPSPGGCEN